MRVVPHLLELHPELVRRLLLRRARVLPRVGQRHDSTTRDVPPQRHELLGRERRAGREREEERSGGALRQECRVAPRDSHAASLEVRGSGPQP
ncbi:MAG: hypothetical protein AB2L07_04360 [Thermoanaerobaculaceae bacterium]